MRVNVQSNIISVNIINRITKWYDINKSEEIKKNIDESWSFDLKFSIQGGNKSYVAISTFLVIISSVLNSLIIQ